MRHGLTEPQFRRYEPFLVAALRNWPEGLTIPRENMLGLRPVTFVARLRDARLSFAQHKWSSELTALMSDRNLDVTSICIKEDVASVIISADKSTLLFVQPPGLPIFRPQTDADLTSLYGLASRNVLPKPFLIETLNTNAVAMAEPFDIGVTHQNGNTYLIT